MASGIAHDINNAISPIALYTEELLESEPNLSATARSYLETTGRAIQDVAQTIARMNEFYRAPDLALLGPVQLNSLVLQVRELTRARWNDMPQQRGVVIQVSTELTPHLPAVIGIETDIREALVNLVFNAVDAMPEGGALTIRTFACGEGGDRHDAAESAQFSCLEVVDTGTGMDDATRALCFEPFFTTKGERGTGLGLAMVYGMSQRNRAEIKIDSEIGKGTTVRLIFSASPSAMATNVPSEPARPRHGLRVLVVDDDPLVLGALREILTRDGQDAGHSADGLGRTVTGDRRGPAPR